MQTIVYQLIKKIRGVETQTLMEGIACILVILQDALDAMNVSVEGLHAAIAVHWYTGKH